MTRQRGDMLIQSLVSLAVGGIVCLGLGQLMAQTLANNAKINAQNQAVTQMRAMLQRQGPALCAGGSPSITVGSTNIAVTATCSALSATPITVGGVTIANAGTSAEKKISLSANSELFGGNVVVSE